MDIVISPSVLRGTVTAIPSKSQAHRLLICAAFADKQTHIICTQTNLDIEATANCLNALGAQILRTADGYLVDPIGKYPKRADLYCRESGSTLRFLLPIVGAMGVDAVFHLEGRLPQRPLSPLWEEMERMGCVLTRPTQNTVRCTGKLHSGCYSIAGNVSSQYITGLLMALPLISGRSAIQIVGKLESAPYVELTKRCLAAFGVSTDDYQIQYALPLTSPDRIQVEGDWSNAAFFLVAKALGNDITVTGLQNDSAQGDRAVTVMLSKLEKYCTISGADIPDLIPILAVFAACRDGAVFTDIGRLRLKESDRVATVAAMLERLGSRTEVTEDTLRVYPSAFSGCTIDAANDHRIAMAAAIAAAKASGPVTILGAQCVSKSYPQFWEDYRRLGGNYEQYIR